MSAVSSNSGLEDLTALVRNNLVHYQQWSGVEVVPLGDREALCGRPAQKLSNDDDEIGVEYVLPLQLSQYRSSGVTLEALDKVFNQLPASCKRVVLAISSDDGTVVYYTVYQGLRRPRKN
ncbi:AaceriADR135Wp [[Ashbya] aceris (nom. inval.)]|nr:AaceriADR135Wp [[Ashbya] aceris (nom. inval.)]